MSVSIPSLRCHCWSLVLIALVGSLTCARSATATVMDFDALVNSHTRLMHQYTFEGETIAERKQDKFVLLNSNPLNLSAVKYGDDTIENMEAQIQYQQGFDETTIAVVTARPGKDRATNDPLGGVGLSQMANMIHPPGTSSPDRLKMTVETLFRPDRQFLEGSMGGVGMVVAMLETGDQRGYFLYQGDVGTANAQRMSSLGGEESTAASQQTILNPFQPGHWYYFATTYEAILSTDPDTTAITSYVADLTNGQTTLTSLGTVNVLGLFTDGGSDTGRLGIGILPFTDDGTGEHRNAFPGGIDSVAVYSGLLDQATFQAHLDAIYFQALGPPPIPEPSSLGLILTGIVALVARRRRVRS